MESFCLKLEKVMAACFCCFLEGKRLFSCKFNYLLLVESKIIR